VVTDRKTYEDAKSYCSSQSVQYQGVITHAQLMDLRSTVYSRFVYNGKKNVLLLNYSKTMSFLIIFTLLWGPPSPQGSYFAQKNIDYIS
jgi:hypothetical protein